ncbi:Homeodomain-only protein [Caenorhabditis elegans]|uniref:Homeodomain-only protein n=1 Tax=Caenorhabditis elegans TaxID=6239 RepID=Q9XX95_CAEEL|nr:Homeodomain-only protein [Caenorhabditis elegans]CAA20933.2 Homeodomain-only protein [Caenorhabditis elegans]|eukprot:NP_510356.2 C. Elegans Homeobox [Caenorhabditis elegans]
MAPSKRSSKKSRTKNVRRETENSKTQKQSTRNLPNRACKLKSLPATTKSHSDSADQTLGIERSRREDSSSSELSECYSAQNYLIQNAYYSEKYAPAIIHKLLPAFEANKNPNNDEILEIMADTGLSRKEVRRWFQWRNGTNFRIVRPVTEEQKKRAAERERSRAHLKVDLEQDPI